MRKKLLKWSKQNRRIVIDEKGDPLLVDNTEIRNTCPLYCSESFSARTRNVGKYSHLNAAERCYHSLLIKYLTKLKNEDNIYKYDNLTDEEIILKIHECYKIRRFTHGEKPSMSI